MHAIFQSSFLQALGFAIANSLWQTALVWLLFSMISNLLTMSAAFKYRLGAGAQVLSFFWFILTLQFYYQQYQHAWHQSGIRNSFSLNMQALQISGTGLSSQIIKWMVIGEQLLPFLSMAYLLLILLLSIRWFFGYQNTQIIKTAGLAKMPAEWRLFVTKIAGQLQIKQEIKIYLSELISTPMTIGFIKPIILIPFASINHLTTQQLEAIILHELAHIKRYDYLVNLILSVIEISLFFNPFTQLLRKQIKKERENSCDDWVLQFQYNATTYAEALLQIAYLQKSPAFAMAAIGKKNELLTRIKRLIEKKENRFNYRKQLLALLTITAILSSIAWISPIINAHYVSKSAFVKKFPNQQEIQHVAVEPMTINISNPLFNPAFFLSTPLKAEINRSVVSAKAQREASNHFTEKDMPDLFQTIPPMVASALDMASLALANKSVTMEKELAILEDAKKDFSKSFRIDSSALSNFFLHAIKDEIANSLQTMEKDIAKAKLEIAKSQKTNPSIHIDQDKINRDINQAMDELKKMGLEKLVTNAIQIPSLLIERELQKDKISKVRAEAERIMEESKKIKQITEKEASRIENEIEENTIPPYPKSVETIDIVNTVFTKLVLLAKEDPNNFKNLSEERIESFIKNLSAIQSKMKTIPILFKEKNPSKVTNNDQKIVIQLQ